MKHWVTQTFDNDEHRLVLFIDDLDRCLPEVALEVLEALKLYLNIPGLLFVAGLDDHVISQVIVGHYSKHSVDADKARHYLAKIFQVEYHMEPSDTKASGFLDKRISELNKLTDGIWNRSLPDEISTTDDALRSYRPAVEKALRDLGSSNPREFTRLLNSLLVRAVAAREMPVKTEGSTEELRFAQGAQIFLIERILIRHLDLGAARRNPLLNSSFCHWLEKLSATRRDHPGLENILATRLPGESVGKGMPTPPDKEPRYIPEFQEIEELAGRIPHAPEALRVLNQQAWDLLLIPFDPTIAAATATTQALPSLEKGQDPDSFEIIEADIRDQLGLPEGPISDEDLKKVTELHLTFSKVSDLTPLKSLTSLRELSLRGTQVSDLTALKSLTSLQVLDLDGTQVSDFTVLKRLTSLQVLYLGGTDIRDLTDLEGLSDIQKLDLGHTRVSDLSVLRHLGALRVLDVKETPVIDLEPLEHLYEMVRLDLRGCHAFDLSPLRELCSLERLDTRGNQIRSLQPLEKLTELHHLGLNDTTVSEIAPIQNLVNLKNLYLARTGVIDLKPLQGLTALGNLILDSTKVADLSPLYGLKDCLRTLSLKMTPASRDVAAIKELREALPHTQISI
jgi:internalin A